MISLASRSIKRLKRSIKRLKRTSTFGLFRRNHFVLDRRFIFISSTLYYFIYFQATEFYISTTFIHIAIGMAFVQKMGYCMLASPKFSIYVIIGIASTSLPSNTNAPIWSMSIEIHGKFLLGRLLLSRALGLWFVPDPRLPDTYESKIAKISNFWTF